MEVTFVLFPIVCGIVVIIFALVSFTLWRVVKKTRQINPAAPKILQFHEDKHDYDKVYDYVESVNNANENTEGPRIKRLQSARSLF